MRRKDRQETNPEQISQVINRCDVIRLGLSAPEGAYIVPMNFGWEMENDRPVFYMHSAREGRKLDLIAASGRAGFEMDCSHRLVTGPEACDYSFRYECVIGTGAAELVTDPAEKARALAVIVAHQAGRELPVPPEAAAGVAIIRLSADEFSCKRRL
ncbi:MAG: pyridoxamine 5'-phosphate oxidase family protein [Clostridiales bacterium]|nr:pyridoxamine 5'-phosphate oxidase family protein [Clostridiales bacterium]